jgi:hypothetical protein
MNVRVSVGVGMNVGVAFMVRSPAAGSRRGDVRFGFRAGRVVSWLAMTARRQVAILLKHGLALVGRGRVVRETSAAAVPLGT